MSLQRKLKRSTPFNGVGKTQHHGEWYTKSQIDEIITRAEDRAIEKACKMMILIGATIVNKKVGKVYRKDKRIPNYYALCIELMQHATSPTEDMKETEAKLIKEVPSWKGK